MNPESSQPSPPEAGHVSAGLPRELRLKAGQDDDQIEDKTNIDNRKHSRLLLECRPVQQTFSVFVRNIANVGLSIVFVS